MSSVMVGWQLSANVSAYEWKLIKINIFFHHRCWIFGSHWVNTWSISTWHRIKRGAYNCNSHREISSAGCILYIMSCQEIPNWSNNECNNPIKIVQHTQQKGRTLVDDAQLGPPLGLCLSRTSPIATSWCSAGCQPRDGVLPVRIPLFLPVSVSVWWDKGVLEHFTSSYYTSSLVYLMQESSFMSLVQDVPDFQLPTELAQRETGGRLWE